MAPYQIGTGGGQDGVEIFGETGVSISVLNEKAERVTAMSVAQGGTVDFAQQPTVNGQPIQASAGGGSSAPAASKLFYGTITFHEPIHAAFRVQNLQSGTTIAAIIADRIPTYKEGQAEVGDCFSVDTAICSAITALVPAGQFDQWQDVFKVTSITPGQEAVEFIGIENANRYYISLLNTDGKKRSLTITSFAAPRESRVTWTDTNVTLELNDWDYQSGGAGFASLIASLNGRFGEIVGTPGGIIGTNYTGTDPIKAGMNGDVVMVVGETAWDDMSDKAEGTSRIIMAPDDLITATADVFGIERVRAYLPNNNPDWATTLIEKAQHWQGKYFWATDDFKRILFVGNGNSVELYGSYLGATGKLDIYIQQVNQGSGYSHVGSAQINVSDGSKYVGMISDIDTVFATDGSTMNSQYGFHTDNGGVQLDNHSGVDALLVCTLNPIMF